ncbi:class I SAM-dependent methyltransferase [Candidatus Gottesmanbacteria bacterium]|nr:class I SAM-dependent methyltransferase [Candidatus Gottesmanbacteria bacterium]
MDVEFKPPFLPLLHKIEAKASKLPFKDSSYDAVISMDMLEHLPKKEREKAIFEIIRVGRRKVFIGVPAGKEALEQDKKLDEYYQKRFGKRFLFLEEQINFGLPEKEEIHDIIERAGIAHQKELKIKIIGNENLYLREFLMRGWMTKNFFMDVFYRKIMLLFIPIMRYFNQEPFYRQLFFVKIY